jgi:hypothetical protein
VLSLDFVRDKVNSELDPRIEHAREMHVRLRLHVDGRQDDLQNFLERINNYENELQFQAREKHAISNKFVTEELLRPVDNAFHARGGSRNYKFKTGNKEDELINKLVNVKSNSSLSEYIEQEWFHRHITDPNGLIFMEVVESENDSEDEMTDENDSVIEPTYKSIESIRAYEQDGIYVKWVIFEPHEIINDEKEPENLEKQTKKFWAVDKQFYYEFVLTNNELKEVDRKENSFDRVPAILCSNIHDNVTGWKKSPIDAQVELLNKYLVSSSVLNIAEFFHNYLQQWTYVDDCKQCNGTGKVRSQNLQSRENNGESMCPVCEGTGNAGRKDVTDIIKLRIPDADGVKIDPPSGFIFAPTEAWENQIESVDRTKDMAFFSQWGTLIERGAENETATGRFIDAQPVNNRLNKYSKSIEIAHTAIANFIGQFYFPVTFERAIIQYGRRYMIETPDQIWEKYMSAKKDNAPTSTLDLLLFQYYESEFRENEQLFIFETKKAKLEPFVHWGIETVKDLNVKQEDYFKKLYFSDWIQTKERRYIIDTDLQKLNEELSDYAIGKMPVSEPINNDNNNNNEE